METWSACAEALLLQALCSATIINPNKASQSQTGVYPRLRCSNYSVGLGETDQAFEWLERAYEERSSRLTFLRVDPILDSLRSDTRYLDLLRRMELAA